MNTTFRYCVLLAAIVTAFPLHARVTATNDPTFQASMGVNGMYVHCLLVQPDDKIIIGGNFQTVDNSQRTNLARLTAKGRLDESFSTGCGPDNEVLALARQSDGKILVGGAFANVANIPQRRIARLNTNGSVDATFITGSGPNDLVRAIAIQPDGRIVIVGFFTSVNGVSRKNIARLNSNGSLDTSFNPGTGPSGGNLFTLLIQPDGKILTAGEFSAFSGLARGGITRLNEDGTQDPTFKGTGTDGWIGSMRQQADGKILLAGDFLNMNHVARTRIARIYSDGTLDTNFNAAIGTASTSVFALVHNLVLDEDGSIIVAGSFNTANGVSCSHLVRLEKDGTLDRSFTVQPGGPVRFHALNSLGRLVVGGEFTTLWRQNWTRIARLGLADDSSYLPPGFSNVHLDKTGYYFTFRASPETNALVQCSTNLVDWKNCTNVAPGVALRFNNYYSSKTNRLFYRIK